MLAPTLIVGLGGTGCDIVSRVERMTTDEQKESISFAVFDTDVNELRKLKESGFSGYCIQTSAKQTVGQYLSNDLDAKDKWFPVNDILNKKTVTEGAGQIRAISRLAFNTTVKGGNLEPLHKAIERLYRLTGDSMDQAIRVIIVSSLAGGTGSGLILPAALYIKQHLLSKYQQNAAIIRGFFMLPEVFYSVIGVESERNNLKANAYATLRELDAFLTKGDGTIDERYQDLKFMIPRIGGEGNEDYDVMPYDFCFLYDAQNKNSQMLVSSLENYKSHAAQCIYAQSISPMQSRSNSSEDNVIRQLCKDGGRNRYCGAGSSRLRYPYEDIRDYLAFVWAQESISDEWTRVDQEYEDILKKQNQQRQEGVFLPPQQRYAHYIDTTRSRAKGESGRAFDKMVDRECQTRDEKGLPTGIYKWDAYLQSLDEHIDLKCKTKIADMNDIGVTTAVENISKLKSGEKIKHDEQLTKSEVLNTLDDLEKYKRTMQEKAPEFAVNLVYEVLDAKQKKGEIKPNYTIDKWITDDKNNVIHPNAARYFLYNLVDLVQELVFDAQEELEKIRRGWNRFETKAFDDESTKDVKETARDYANQVNENIRFLIKTMDDDVKDKLGNEFAKYYNYTCEYILHYTRERVYQELAQFVANLNEAFEVFYGSLSTNVEKLDGSIEDIYSKYINKKGYTERFVCASPKCLDVIRKSNINANVADELPGGLRNNMFEAVKRYAKRYAGRKMDIDISNTNNQKIHAANYFANIFETEVLDYWKSNVKKSCDDSININVLEALQKEAEYEADCTTSRDINNYVSEVIDEMNRLAEPFIESPIGEEPRIIPTCTYHVSLPETNGLDKALKDEKIFKNGVKSENVDIYQMIFYKAVYALRANMLSKFAPPLDEETLKRDGGSYYKAYFELINQIDADSKKTKVISPHLDKTWHLISSLPDLDEGNQRKIQRLIVKDFAFGIVFGDITYRNSGTHGEDKAYSVKIPKTKLIVSNGTICDEFYEIYDALTINPIVQNGLHKLLESKIEKELLVSTVLNESVLYKSLEGFRIEEFGSDIRSILEIPLLYKASAPAEWYERYPADEMIDDILDEILVYLNRYLPDSDVEFEYKKLLKEQWALMNKNIVKLSKENAKCRYIAKEPLKADIDDKMENILDINLNDIM